MLPFLQVPQGLVPRGPLATLVDHGMAMSILGKYGSWREDWFGWLDLVYRQAAEEESGATDGGVPELHQYLVQLRLQLQTLQHPESQPLKTQQILLTQLQNVMRQPAVFHKMTQMVLRDVVTVPGPVSVSFQREVPVETTVTREIMHPHVRPFGIGVGQEQTTPLARFATGTQPPKLVYTDARTTEPVQKTHRLTPAETTKGSSPSSGAQTTKLPSSAGDASSKTNVPNSAIQAPKTNVPSPAFQAPKTNVPSPKDEATKTNRPNSVSEVQATKVLHSPSGTQTTDVPRLAGDARSTKGPNSAGESQKKNLSNSTIESHTKKVANFTEDAHSEKVPNSVRDVHLFKEPNSTGEASKTNVPNSEGQALTARISHSAMDAKTSEVPNSAVDTPKPTVLGSSIDTTSPAVLNSARKKEIPSFQNFTSESEVGSSVFSNEVLVGRSSGYMSYTGLTQRLSLIPVSTMQALWTTLVQRMQMPYEMSTSSEVTNSFLATVGIHAPWMLNLKEESPAWRMMVSTGWGSEVPPLVFLANRLQEDIESNSTGPSMWTNSSAPSRLMPTPAKEIQALLQQLRSSGLLPSEGQNFSRMTPANQAHALRFMQTLAAIKQDTGINAPTISGQPLLTSPTYRATQALSMSHPNGVKQAMRISHPNGSAAAHQMSHPSENMQAHQMSHPSKVMQTNRMSHPSEIMQANRINHPSEILQAQRKNQPSGSIQAQRISQPNGGVQAQRMTQSSGYAQTQLFIQQNGSLIAQRTSHQNGTVVAQRIGHSNDTMQTQRMSQPNESMQVQRMIQQSESVHIQWMSRLSGSKQNQGFHLYSGRMPTPLMNHLSDGTEQTPWANFQSGNVQTQRMSQLSGSEQNQGLHFNSGRIPEQLMSHLSAGSEQTPWANFRSGNVQTQLISQSSRSEQNQGLHLYSGKMPAPLMNHPSDGSVQTQRANFQSGSEHTTWLNFQSGREQTTRSIFPSRSVQSPWMSPSIGSLLAPWGRPSIRGVTALGMLGSNRLTQAFSSLPFSPAIAPWMLMSKADMQLPAAQASTSLETWGQVPPLVYIESPTQDLSSWGSHDSMGVNRPAESQQPQVSRTQQVQNAGTTITNLYPLAQMSSRQGIHPSWTSTTSRGAQIPWTTNSTRAMQVLQKLATASSTQIPWNLNVTERLQVQHMLATTGKTTGKTTEKAQTPWTSTPTGDAQLHWLFPTLATSHPLWIANPATLTGGTQSSETIVTTTRGAPTLNFEHLIQEMRPTGSTSPNGLISLIQRTSQNPQFQLTRNTRKPQMSLLYHLQLQEEGILYERVRDRYLTQLEEVPLAVPIHHRRELDPDPSVVVRLEHRQPDRTPEPVRSDQRPATQAAAPTVTVEQTGPKPAALDQVDIDRLVDRVYRELQKRLQFERSIRGM